MKSRLVGGLDLILSLREHGGEVDFGEDERWEGCLLKEEGGDSAGMRQEDGWGVDGQEGVDVLRGNALDFKDAGELDFDEEEGCVGVLRGGSAQRGGEGGEEEVIGLEFLGVDTDVEVEVRVWRDFEECLRDVCDFDGDVAQEGSSDAERRGSGSDVGHESS